MEQIYSKKGCLFIFVCVLVETVMCKGNSVNYDGPKKHGRLHNDLLTKISLTQKGYIQFLKYIEPVPTMTEYTFCLWIKSYNLTYSHPLLSYSKHEEERLIRVWISPHGQAINLEIHGVQVFKLSMHFKEHQWYHICQSWSSDDASWDLFVNGETRLRGHSPKLRGIRIKPGGDIVVGQEYTDFDKGLEDGIEGDIFGFNFVLSATSTTPKYPIYYRKRRSTSLFVPKSHHSYPEIIYNKENLLFLPETDTKILPMNRTIHSSSLNGYNHQKHSKLKLCVVDHKQSARNSLRKNRCNRVIDLVSNQAESYPERKKRMKNVSKSLGLMLVELSRNCIIGKGAPVQGKKVLISWTKNNVRVFGGAIVKHVTPFC